MDYKNRFFELDSQQNLSYFDWAASSLKPLKIVDSVAKFEKYQYAPVGRSYYPSAVNVTNKVSEIRNLVKSFICAQSEKQIVFCSGTTMALNQIAMMLKSKLNPESEVIVSDLDHHSLRLVWENLANLGLCKLWKCPISQYGILDIQALQNKIKQGNVSVVCISAMSNVLGVKQDLKLLNEICKNVFTIVDFAQWVAHDSVDVMDFDFCAFSGHKMYADSGVGILYIKNPDEFSPVIFGGGMVKSENVLKYEESPFKFEAGTLPVSQIVSLGEAINFITDIGYDNIQIYEEHLADLLISKLKTISGIKFLNPNISKEPVISFNVEGVSPLDISILLGNSGICVRSGNHCASWIHNFYNLNSSIRFSIGLGINEFDVEHAEQTLNIILDKLK